MKKNNFQQLKNTSIGELQKKLADSYNQLRDLKFDLSQGKIKNNADIKNTKKIIARVLTILKEKK
ncbi:MAG: 50S ribosomal protein L29 [Patescibacteria group bacterium]